MASVLNPYIHFKDNARTAMEFYQSVLGGELTVNTFGEFGAEGDDAAKVMHSTLKADLGFTLMAADTPHHMDYTPGNTVTISISGDDADALRGYWEQLSTDGTVAVPLEKQAWGDEFGMCADKFGVEWMVNITPAQ